MGGTVRDYLLKHESLSDLDFAVEADSYDEMKTSLLARGLTIWQERPEFVTLRGWLPEGALGNFGGLTAWDDPVGVAPEHRNRVAGDFTLCRTETQYSDKRHPDTVTPANIIVDLSRRDFTVNAVAIGEDGFWVDPFGGISDAHMHWLNTVGSAHDRFAEDPLRILRAIRFLVTRPLYAVTHLSAALSSPALCATLQTLPHERVREELNKALKCDWFDTMEYLMHHTYVGRTLDRYFPDLWFKSTSEER